jgi:hypothetical protein
MEANNDSAIQFEMQRDSARKAVQDLRDENTRLKEQLEAAKGPEFLKRAEYLRKCEREKVARECAEIADREAGRWRKSQGELAARMIRDAIRRQFGVKTVCDACDRSEARDATPSEPSVLHSAPRLRNQLHNLFRLLPHVECFPRIRIFPLLVRLHYRRHHKRP